MSVDLMLVCADEPDVVVGARLARVVLAGHPTLSPVTVQEDANSAVVTAGDAGVTCFRLPPEHHEFTGRHLVVLEPRQREVGTYLVTLVLAHLFATGYDGRIIDEAGFYPVVSAQELLHRLLTDPDLPGQVWTDLRAARQSAAPL